MTLWHRLRQRSGDVLVVGLFSATLIEITVSELDRKPLMYVANAAWTLPLLLRRRFPLAAPLTTGVVFAITSLFAARPQESIATPVLTALVATWLIGSGNERRRAVVGLAAMYACVQFATARFGDLTVGDVVFTAMVVTLPWLAGQTVRTRAERARELIDRTKELEASQSRAALDAVADERSRIARELHDVVAHSISVMTIQAGGARLYLDDDPDRAEEALLCVEETGRETLGEMRRLLGVLRSDMSSHDALDARPSMAHVEALVGQYRQAGLSVDLRVSGTARPLPPGLDLAAYRVVQEALTNVLRHAGSAHAQVELTYAPDELEIDVADDGHGGAHGNGDGGGHGLVGMRERAAIYAGSMDAGPSPTGGFEVHVRFPLERRPQ